MPEVSFYVLSAQSANSRYLFACKLTEKAYRSGAFIYILMDDDRQCRKLDDLLWTFRAGSFIPHQIYSGSTPDLLNKVLIGTIRPPEHWQQTIINLALQNAYLNCGSQRILEILDASETIKQAGRSRYRQYQHADFSITTHKL